MVKIAINNLSLKVERVNAKAMLEGFQKKGKTYHVSMYTANSKSKSLENSFDKLPKLLTYQRGNPRSIYPISSIGHS